MNLVEFVLCAPILLSLFLAPIQIQRLWFAQLAIERETAGVARRLGASDGDESALRSLAITMAPGATVELRVREIAPPTSSSLRPPFRREAIDLTLTRPSGIRFPGIDEPLCTAHRRELRT